jgi:hypothetical protein
LRIANEAGHGVVGNERRNLVRRVPALRSKPVRRPVQRAEKGARADRGIRRPQRAPPDAIGNQRPHAALVAIALGDDACTEAWRQCVDGQVRGRPLDLVEQAEHVRGRHLVQPDGQRCAAGLGRGERVEQPIERPILAEEEDLVLAGKIVIEVARRQVGGDGDLAHASRREAARAKDPRRRAHDLDAARLGAN